MNYALSSGRKISNFSQNIITTINDTKEADAHTHITLGRLKTWHSALKPLDPVVSTANHHFNSYIETPSDSEENYGTEYDDMRASGLVTISCTENAFPQTIQIEIYDAKPSDIGAGGYTPDPNGRDIVSIIKNKVDYLTGKTLPDVKWCVTSAILDIYYIKEE